MSDALSQQSPDRKHGGGILVIKLGALGDIFLAMEAFHAIRTHHAGERVVLLTRPQFAKFAERMPWFDEVWVDPGPKLWQVAGWLAVRKRLRSGDFDRVYDLQCNDRTGFYFRLLGSRRPEWCGVVKGCSHPSPDFSGLSLHVTERSLRMISAAGVPWAGPADLSWLDGSLEGLPVPERFVLIAPGCAPHRPEKRWPAAGYAEFARLLADRGLAVVAVGTSVDHDIIGAIRAANPDVVDFSGKTSLGQLAALARRAAGVVGNDTGPVHITAAVGAPTLVLMSGVTDPVRMVPRGPSVGWLREEKLADLAVGPVMEALRLRPAGAVES